MEHIATLYTHEEGPQHPNLIRYFWDPCRITLFQQKEYLIGGIRCPEEAEEWDPNTDIWNAREVAIKVAGTDVPGIYDMENGNTVVVYEREL